jgi:hypothetical protein
MSKQSCRFAYHHPGFLVGPLSGSPSDDNGPPSNGCRTIADDDGLISLSPQATATASLTESILSASTLCNDLNPTPMIPCVSHASGSEFPFKEKYMDDNSADAAELNLLVHSLSRQALRMLWHQRLGHLNFRRLSTMHRFVKGMPAFKRPNALEECPICLAAKLRK